MSEDDKDERDLLERDQSGREGLGEDRPAQEAAGTTAQIVRIALIVSAGFFVLGLVLVVGGEVWNRVTVDDPGGANIGAGLIILAGGGVAVIGLLACVGLLVVRRVVRRR